MASAPASPSKEETEANYNLSKRRFMKQVLQWNGAKLKTTHDERTLPDVRDVATLLQSWGYKLKYFGKPNVAADETNDETRPNQCEVEVNCKRTGITANLESMDCKCQNLRDLDGAVFWEVSWSCANSQVGRQNSLQSLDAGSNELPELKPGTASVVQEILELLVDFIKEEDKVNKKLSSSTTGLERLQLSSKNSYKITTPTRYRSLDALTNSHVEMPGLSMFQRSRGKMKSLLEPRLTGIRRIEETKTFRSRIPTPDLSRNGSLLHTSVTSECSSIDMEQATSSSPKRSTTDMDDNVFLTPSPRPIDFSLFPDPLPKMIHEQAETGASPDLSENQARTPIPKPRTRAGTRVVANKKPAEKTSRSSAVAMQENLKHLKEKIKKPVVRPTRSTSNAADAKAGKENKIPGVKRSIAAVSERIVSAAQQRRRQSTPTEATKAKISGLRSIAVRKTRYSADAQPEKALKGLTKTNVEMCKANRPNRKSTDNIRKLVPANTSK